ncbi:MAG TPA: protein-disulfide reductase DsbD domain-containing protein [Candidatus Sulfotelmatobacter sp.]|nr:protein-disulfide reductase DsbD domain-containing protein [Candidatus Sulfotelmatobacter sp.]
METRQTHIRLLAARTAVGEAPVTTLGLQIRLEPGWKIYWRSPGDAGIPPQFDWSGSSNLDRAAVRWPVPHRFRLFDLDTFGYTGEVVLPIEARLTKPAAPLALRLKLAYGICREVCIPYEATLALALPAGAGAPSAFAPLIERYAARVPTEGNAAGLRITAAHLQDGPAGRELVVDAASDRPMLAPDLLVEGPAGLSFSAPKTSPGAAPSGVVFRSDVDGPKGIALAGQEVTLTLIDGERAIERHLRLDAAGR